MAGIGIDALLNMVGAQYDRTLIGKITNGFSDAFSSSIGQWFNDIRMRNRVGKEAYQEGQKSAWNQQTGLDLTNAQRQVMDYNAEEAEKAWNRQMAYERDKYSVQTQSMTDAGLNPAMMYGGGNLVGTMANGQQASAGMPSASNSFGEMFNVMSNLAMLGAQQNLMRSQARLADAEANSISYGIEKTKEDTEGLAMFNQFYRDTMEERKEAVKLANDLSIEEKRNLIQERNESIERVNNLKEETKTEQSKQALNQAEQFLRYTEAWDIQAMQPYKKAEMSARSSQERAYALLLGTQQAVQDKMLREGYYDSIISTAEASNLSAQALAQIREIERKMRSGETIKPIDLGEGPVAKEIAEWVNQFTTKPLNNIISVFANGMQFMPFVSAGAGDIGSAASYRPIM